MTPEQLYEALRKVQEPKGYFFNKDKRWSEIIEGPLVNKNATAIILTMPTGVRGPRKGPDIVCPASIAR
jgi:hypothetical protein